VNQEWSTIINPNTTTVNQLREISITKFPELVPSGTSTLSLFLNGKELEDNKKLSIYPEVSVVQVKEER
jgi:hypothetical protein